MRGVQSAGLHAFPLIVTEQSHWHCHVAEQSTQGDAWLEWAVEGWTARKNSRRNAQKRRIVQAGDPLRSTYRHPMLLQAGQLASAEEGVGNFFYGGKLLELAHGQDADIGSERLDPISITFGMASDL